MTESTLLDSRSAAHYGFDAPGVMAGLLTGGLCGIIAGLATHIRSERAWGAWLGTGIATVSAVPAFLGTCMLMYSLVGKHRTRDALLNAVPWKGDERVLDIGTGRGLMAIGAAKRLTTGQVIGIDLWSKTDLSSNTLENAQENAALEGVSGKVSIQTGDARRLDFSDNSFDRVVSLLCLHNIEDRAEQRTACHEIARVLKPGGIVLLGDYIPVSEYARSLSDQGLGILRQQTAFTTALGLMWILIAEKPSPKG